MDPKLLALIRAYQARVSWAVDQLASVGIPRPTSALGWAMNGVDRRGRLARGIRYSKHGYGCAFHYPGGTVDFDFGREGEITGFDAWRLWHFRDASRQLPVFASRDVLESAIVGALAGGYIVNSGYILYYLNEDRLDDKLC